MKRLLLLSSVAFALTSIETSAQTNIGYAITGNQHTNDYSWLSISKIDINSGKNESVFLDQQQTDYSLVDASTKKSVANRNSDNTNFIAATAYDRKTGKLYYIPMYSNELRWIDMDDKAASKTIYTRQFDVIAKSNMQIRDESKNVTRMVIGADGAGYAITNDGNNFYRFTTGKNPSIVDMGALIDNESNKGVSVHNKCSSWGGDVVADANGNLVLISANRMVFDIDVKTRVATLRGTIQGLPANFTANGAAVDENNNIIVSSAMMGHGFYKLNVKDLSATKIDGSEMAYSVSDLATPNLLNAKGAQAIVYDAPLKNSDSRIYPNPVTTGTFRLQLGDVKPGTYRVNITDVSGKTIQSDRLNVTNSTRFANINIQGKPVAGVYMVKIVDKENNAIVTDKLIVQ